MGDVVVKGGRIRGGRIETLRVHLHNLPERTIDRDTALAWMRDGHSLIPVLGGRRGPALQLVEVGDDARYIRTDNAATPEDALPDLLPAP